MAHVPGRDRAQVSLLGVLVGRRCVGQPVDRPGEGFDGRDRGGEGALLGFGQGGQGQVEDGGVGGLARVYRLVIWELSGTGEQRQRRSLRLIGYAFAALAAYLLVQSSVVLATGYHPRHSVPGIIWTAMTAAVMFALAAGKARTGAALGNPVLQTEGRVTLIDGILATAVLLGLVLNAALGWWWADPAAGYVLVFYAAREVRDIFITKH